MQATNKAKTKHVWLDIVSQSCRASYSSARACNVVFSCPCNRRLTRRLRRAPTCCPDGEAAGVSMGVASISSLMIRSGSCDRNRTCRDVRRFVEPSSKRSRYERCGSTSVISAFSPTRRFCSSECDRLCHRRRDVDAPVHPCCNTRLVVVWQLQARCVLFARMRCPRVSRSSAGVSWFDGQT